MQANPVQNVYKTHLHLFSLDVHLDQRVSDKVSEATAVEVAVRVCVVLLIVDLWKLQATVLVKILPMEVLMGAKHLHRRKPPHIQ